MARQLHFDAEGAFLDIHINRPGSGNLVTPRMMLALGDLAAHLLPRHKAVFIQGRGRDFCLGREPRPIPGGNTDTAHEAHASVMAPILATYRALGEAPVPIIALVQGRAHGFGCGLCGACDMVLAEEDADFALPEMAKGIPPTLVMCALADVNRKTLLDMVYSGRSLNAGAALAAGIVSRVVAPGALDPEAAVLRDTLAGYDRAQIGYIKGFASRPGHLDPAILSELAGFTLATAMTRPR